KVYLHTQHMEAFGIAVVEAMAAGAVPLVPRCGGPWLDILNCKQGIYGYSYSSLEEAANIIKKLLKDENHRRNIALKAVQRASNFKSSNFEVKILKIVNHFSGRTNEMLSS
ncbi:MAG: glycosyltransferase, partial [Candidatus Bathyarchaeia archaeon]